MGSIFEDLFRKDLSNGNTSGRGGTNGHTNGPLNTDTNGYTNGHSDEDNKVSFEYLCQRNWDGIN